MTLKKQLKLQRVGCAKETQPADTHECKSDRGIPIFRSLWSARAVKAYMVSVFQGANSEMSGQLEKALFMAV